MKLRIVQVTGTVNGKESISYQIQRKSFFGWKMHPINISSAECKKLNRNGWRCTNIKKAFYSFGTLEEAKRILSIITNDTVFYRGNEIQRIFDAYNLRDCFVNKNIYRRNPIYWFKEFEYSSSIEEIKKRIDDRYQVVSKVIKVVND